MPAEAIHLSALEDSLARSLRTTQELVSSSELRGAARLGALFVDLPYFDRVFRSMATHALGGASALSAWGERLHHQTPIRLLHALAHQCVRLTPRLPEGRWLTAFTLGFTSHAAVDRSLHPLVNRLAADRSSEGGNSLLKEHQQVEKLQSIVFHGERLGRDLLGTRALRAFLGVEAGPLYEPGGVARALTSAMLHTYEQFPSARQLKGWAGGYGAYVRLLSNLPARLVLSPAARQRERVANYDEVQFPLRFEAAVKASLRCTEAMARFISSGAVDPAEVNALLPEGTLDPEAEQGPVLGAVLESPLRRSA